MHGLVHVPTPRHVYTMHNFFVLRRLRGSKVAVQLGLIGCVVSRLCWPHFLCGLAPRAGGLLYPRIHFRNLNKEAPMFVRKGH